MHGFCRTKTGRDIPTVLRATSCRAHCNGLPASLGPRDRQVLNLNRLPNRVRGFSRMNLLKALNNGSFKLQMSERLEMEAPVGKRPKAKSTGARVVSTAGAAPQPQPSTCHCWSDFHQFRLVARRSRRRRPFRYCRARE